MIPQRINVQRSISYRKIWRLALITSPLLGLFGATPVFVFAKTEIYRLSVAFLTVTAMIFVFWAVNIALLRLLNNVRPFLQNWIRYLASSLICTLIIFLAAGELSNWTAGQISPDFIKHLPPHISKTNLPPMPQGAIAMPLLQSQSINIIIIVLLELVLLRQRKQLIEIENTQLKMANLEAKHGQLKQQLHPHFLFNSLSTLSALIKRSPESAQNYLEKLSELLRFSTNNNSHATISLDMELELCSNYLQMQQVRFGNALSFHIDVRNEMSLKGTVPVYSIQLLAENAIKHNMLTVHQPLHICISGDPDQNAITVTNNIQRKYTAEEGNGVGLANLAERYRLLEKEEIKIQRTEKEFRVTIKVLRHESSNY